MNNYKYTTAKTIYDRLNMSFRKKMAGVPLRHVIEWCATVEIEYIRDYPQFVQNRDVELNVNNYRALLPCNIYKLERVVDKYDSPIFKYGNNGSYLFFDNIEKPIQEGIVKINFLGIPIDDDKMPLILKGHEESCYHYCVLQIFQEDEAEGKVSPNFMQKKADEFNISVQADRASHRHISDNERALYRRAMVNMINNPNYFQR
jgi:hypothetical protein